jgi:Protein of unknown function (DUF2798)
VLVLSRKGGNILFVILMVLAMSLIMSLAMTVVNTGVRGDLIGRWMRGFVISFLVALPSAFIVVPLMRRLADAFVSR